MLHVAICDDAENCPVEIDVEEKYDPEDEQKHRYYEEN